jgi:hypothetical protein
MLPKGTKRRLMSNHSHYYVKLEDLDFAWWRLENFELDESKRMCERLTDEMLIFGKSGKIFEFF